MTSPACDVKPLARSLDPLPGESLAGYVLRLADRHDRTPNAMTGRTALRERHAKAPAGLALAMPEPVLASFSQACRLAPEEADALTLSRHTGTLLAQPGRHRNDSLLQAATAAWISPGRTRYCPDCLRGDDHTRGYWQASWQLPWHYACLRHQRLLADACPACHGSVGQPAPGAAFGSLVPNPGLDGLVFDSCRHRPGPAAGPCGHRLSAPDDRCPLAGDDALAAQHRLGRLLGLDGSPSAAPTLAGAPISLPMWVPALQGVVVLIRAATGLPGAPTTPPELQALAAALALPQTSGAEVARLLHPNTPPLDAASGAALITAALHVLGAPTRDDLDDRLAPYREPVREHRPGMWKSWLRQYPDHSTKRLLKRHRRWGSLAAATRTTAPPAAGARSSGLRGRHLAHRIPAPHDRLLDPYRHLPVSDTGLHRAASVLLWQRVEGASRRADAAAALGYADPGTVDQTVGRLQRLLAADGLTAAYTATLDTLQEALVAGPLTDWAARRAALAYWTVPERDWARLKVQLQPLQKRDGRQPDWDLRRLVVSQIIWEDLTQAEPHQSPAFAAVGADTKARTRLRQVSQQFRAHIDDGTLPGFAPVVYAYRADVLARLPGSCRSSTVAV